MHAALSCLHARCQKTLSMRPSPTPVLETKRLLFSKMQQSSTAPILKRLYCYAGIACYYSRMPYCTPPTTSPHPPHQSPQTSQVHKHAAYCRRRVPKPCVAGCQHPLEQKPLQCCAEKARVGSGCAKSRPGAQNPSFAATVSAVYNRLNCCKASTPLVYAPKLRPARTLSP